MPPGPRTQRMLPGKFDGKAKSMRTGSPWYRTVRNTPGTLELPLRMNAAELPLTIGKPVNGCPGGNGGTDVASGSNNVPSSAMAYL